MRDAHEVAQALADWATATCPAIAGTYAGSTNRKNKALPDAMVEITSQSVSPRAPVGSAAGRSADLQQIAGWEIHAASIMLMVPPEPADAATETLTAMVKQLGESLLNDESLGERVEAASPFFDAAYVPAFAIFDDTTRGRVATFTCVVAYSVAAT